MKGSFSGLCAQILCALLVFGGAASCFPGDDDPAQTGNGNSNGAGTTGAGGASGAGAGGARPGGAGGAGGAMGTGNVTTCSGAPATFPSAAQLPVITAMPDPFKTM